MSLRSIGGLGTITSLTESAGTVEWMNHAFTFKPSDCEEINDVSMWYTLSVGDSVGVVLGYYIIHSAVLFSKRPDRVFIFALASVEQGTGTVTVLLGGGSHGILKRNGVFSPKFPDGDVFFSYESFFATSTQFMHYVRPGIKLNYVAMYDPTRKHSKMKAFSLEFFERATKVHDNTFETIGAISRTRTSRLAVNVVDAICIFEKEQFGTNIVHITCSRCNQFARLPENLPNSLFKVRFIQSSTACGDLIATDLIDLKNNYRRIASTAGSTISESNAAEPVTSSEADSAYDRGLVVGVSTCPQEARIFCSCQDGGCRISVSDVGCLIRLQNGSNGSPGHLTVGSVVELKFRRRTTQFGWGDYVATEIRETTEKIRNENELRNLGLFIAYGFVVTLCKDYFTLDVGEDRTVCGRKYDLKCGIVPDARKYLSMGKSFKVCHALCDLPYRQYRVICFPDLCGLKLSSTPTAVQCTSQHGKSSSDVENDQLSNHSYHSNSTAVLESEEEIKDSDVRVQCDELNNHLLNVLDVPSLNLQVVENEETNFASTSTSSNIEADSVVENPFILADLRLNSRGNRPPKPRCRPKRSRSCAYSAGTTVLQTIDISEPGTSSSLTGLDKDNLLISSETNEQVVREACEDANDHVDSVTKRVVVVEPPPGLDCSSNADTDSPPSDSNRISETQVPLPMVDQATQASEFRAATTQLFNMLHQDDDLFSLLAKKYPAKAKLLVDLCWRS